jgi:hypothetical protein
VTGQHKLLGEQYKLLAERYKLAAEGDKFERERFMYPIAIGLGFFGRAARFGDGAPGASIQTKATAEARKIDA